MTDWDGLERLGGLLGSKPYRFASTMKLNPHCYTLRQAWQDDPAFDWAVQFVRQHGYQVRYKSRPYTFFDVNCYSFWTMGAPLDETILINRQVRDTPTPYDQIAPQYDALFADKDSHLENKAVFRLIGDLSALSVLDVGCGTGLCLEYATPGRYLGIDPSLGMLARMRAVWPEARTVCTPLQSFVGGRYDVVLALFGLLNYLTAEEITRLPQLVRPGGRVVAMAYADDYEPVTYAHTGVQVPCFRHRWEELLPPGQATAIGPHRLWDWRAPE